MKLINDLIQRVRGRVETAALATQTARIFEGFENQRLLLDNLIARNCKAEDAANDRITEARFERSRAITQADQHCTEIVAAERATVTALRKDRDRLGRLADQITQVLEG